MDSLDKKNRAQLNEIAVAQGIENPEKYGTKKELIAVLQGDSNNAPDTSPEPAPVEAKTAAEVRKSAIEQGREDARINLEKEAADQPNDGE